MSTSTAGYSGTPLVRKLGIKPDARVGLIGAPDGFDVIVAFFDRRSRLERRLAALVGALDPDGGLWIAWPKRASGVPTDLTDNVVRDLGLAIGLVDNKICAIDQVWSGQRLVYRLRDRPAANRA